MASIPTSGKNAKVNFFGAHGHCKECTSRDKRSQTQVGNECFNGKVLIIYIYMERC